MRAKLTSILFCCVALCLAHPAGHVSANPSPQIGTSANGETLWIKANGLRLKTRIYSSAKLSPHPVLVVVLHGDLPHPSYHYEFASQAAARMEDVVVAALLRPGYVDDTGDESEGEQGLTTGDNYTPEVVDAVARVVDQLKAKFHPAHTVLAGHSGGAAITGDVLGRWPSKVDAAFMVSCPCDLAAWRKHMQKMQNNNPIWSEPVASLSPISLAGKVSGSVRVVLLVGAEDPVAPPELSRQYAEALRSHGDHVTLTIVPGLQHNILLQPAAFDGLAALIGSLEKDAQR